ncbi:MAG: DUF87 domain-containing protein [Candidatus Brocadia sp.]|nr:DUF87 domain-containing protein [Candidatus Brocadia sp.]
MYSDEFDDMIKKYVQGVGDKIYKSVHKSPSIHVGTHGVTGKDLYLPIDVLADNHTYVLGTTRVGKSKFFERIARDIIKSGHGLILLDGKGDLYDDMVNFCALARLEDRTILIDPREKDFSVGINYLEPLGKTTPDVLAGLVLEGLMKFFKENKEFKPWLEEWAPAALQPLIKNNFTLLELFDFMSLQKPAFRETVLKDLQDEFLKDKWNELKLFRPIEQTNILNVVRTRATKFKDNAVLKCMFGQQKTTIDWLKVMNEGGIVLANLGGSCALSERTASFVGATILHQIRTVAPERGKGARKPCFFMVDEFQKFVTSDFATSFDQLLGFGVPFIVGHQHRSQLIEDAPEVLDSIDANCWNKFVFATSRKNAESMALELFDFKGDKIKNEIVQTKFRPVKSYEDIVTIAETEVEGNTATDSAGSVIDQDGIITETASGATGSGSSHISSKSVQRAPITEHEEFQEVTSRTYVSTEEEKEHRISDLKIQPRRDAYWQLKPKQPIPITTSDVKPAVVLDSIKERFKKAVYARYHRPTEEVNKEIDARIRNYLEDKNTTETTASMLIAEEPATFRDTKKPKPMKE